MLNAGCHGLDGNGRNQFEADFLPRVSCLTVGDVQDSSDGELYFVVSNGIRNTPCAPLGLATMPSLSVRHPTQLKAEGRKESGRETSDQEHVHEETMKRDRAGSD
jgi:hypothetical protein